MRGHCPALFHRLARRKVIVDGPYKFAIRVSYISFLWNHRVLLYTSCNDVQVVAHHFCERTDSSIFGAPANSQRPQLSMKYLGWQECFIFRGHRYNH